MTYRAFLAAKHQTPVERGFQDHEPHERLYEFQRIISRWAVRKGSAAIFADCGLGKTLIQLDWARGIVENTAGRVLVLCPIAVHRQTRAEAQELGIAEDRVTVSNYHRLHRFNPLDYSGIVLDESSVLKDYTGKTRRAICEFAAQVPYRLACTATPSPNDLDELLNHAEYLGVEKYERARSKFFVNDASDTNSSWRLKGHAEAEFWQWCGTWSIALATPRDIGIEDNRFDLPPYRTVRHDVFVAPPEGLLMAPAHAGIREHRKSMRDSLAERVAKTAELVNGSDEPWIVWCEYNDESAALAKAIPEAVEVKGSDSPESKEAALMRFGSGQSRVIVTKPSIAGHGLNWQHCCRVAFCGVSYSYERWYQAVRRTWRYGQSREVEIHMVTSSNDASVIDRLEAKQRNAEGMMTRIVPADLRGASRNGHGGRVAQMERITKGDGWTMRLGDSVTTIANIDDESIGLSVFSPPFPSVYTYSDSERDMGNAGSPNEFCEAYGFLAEALLRKTMPGRNACMHIQQIAAKIQVHGFSGLVDFRGPIITSMTRAGWHYVGEIAIDKNPQAAALRTKSRSLLFATLEKDAALNIPCLMDMLLIFRRPGENPEPVDTELSRVEWVEYARPVWPSSDRDEGGIRATRTLNAAEGRDSKDERHICPLQLDVIERAIRLWSNRGDLIYSPFAGIGSEGYGAISLGRRFEGGELKESYYCTAIKNLQEAATHAANEILF